MLLPRSTIVLACLARCVADLPALLAVDWRRVSDLPPQGPSRGGFQDSDGGWLLNGTTIVTAFGYGSGSTPGFFNTAWSLNPSAENASWQALPSAPVSGRQEVSAAAIGNAIFFVGGFNYEPPFTYDDVTKLSVDQATGEWLWSKLPVLPHRVASAGVAALGSRLYVVGGMDYDGQGFYTFSNRSGGIPRLGARVYSIDTAATAHGWRDEPQLPGPPRWCHSVTSVDGRLYVFGGAVTAPGQHTFTAVDNWVFDPALTAWQRLPDLPVASGNFRRPPRSQSNPWASHVRLPT